MIDSLHQRLYFYRAIERINWDVRGRSARQAESGTAVGDLSRISKATFYTWKEKYEHLGVRGLHRLRQM